jgi:hypothetical protein
LIRKFSVSLILTAVAYNFGCYEAELSRKSTDVKPRFAYQVELAGYEFGQADQKGQTDYRSFTQSFEQFPWIDQIEKANKAGKVSPTLTVNDNEKNEALWVSAMGDSNKHTFLIGHVYPKEIKGLFGFGKPRLKKWIEIYLTEDQEFVKECFKLFFDGDTNGLRAKYSKLEKYDEMESQIQD